MNKILAVFVCLALCFAITPMPSASGNTLVTPAKTSLSLCLQQEYLMRDTYERISISYPALTSFAVVAADENLRIGALARLFAAFRMPIPADEQVATAKANAGNATSVQDAFAVAIGLERSTALLMARLIQTTRSTDVMRALQIIKDDSIRSHVDAFSTEAARVATPAYPAPTTRPFAAPVTTRRIVLPDSIDATGRADVSAALTAFIGSVPDGSIISFLQSGVYRIDKAVFFSGRHNLVLDGNGCTLKYASVTGTSQSYSFWYDEGSGSDIWIKNFVLIGSSTHPGIYTPGTSPTGGEYQHGVVICSNRFEVSGCTISAVWGDGFIIFNKATDIWIHDNHVISAGRNGLSVVSGINVLAESNTFEKSGGSAFDVEPESLSDTCANVAFRHNEVGTYGGAYGFNVVNHAAASISTISLSDNTVTGAPLSTYVDSASTVRITGITFTNSTSDVTATGPVMYFKHVDGLTFIGNIQPLKSGSVTWITDCTGVVTS